MYLNFFLQYNQVKPQRKTKLLSGNLCSIRASTRPFPRMPNYTLNLQYSSVRMTRRTKYTGKFNYLYFYVSLPMKLYIYCIMCISDQLYGAHKINVTFFFNLVDRSYAWHISHIAGFCYLSREHYFRTIISSPMGEAGFEPAPVRCYTGIAPHTEFNDNFNRN